MKKKEYIIVITALILSLCIYLGVKYYNSTLNKNEVVIRDRTQEIVLRVPLRKDGYYTIEGDYGKFNLEVVDGRAHAVDVECPNHDCEGMGWISENSLLPMIVCLPNNIIAEVVINE